ncbi:hypothetical protein MA16_Dca001785 [Dendrobium catenatum]|uniref:Uncharacterized protein n=1 Tax=Dendrobium catenatum TaxID=906689 RepID=A0A2I0XDI3_9ASPA|nr:hypothetical protein MA16_Dca001785 [Dendrobium catenatum]
MDSDRLGRTLDWIVGQVGAISQHLKETQTDLADLHRQTIKRSDHLERGRTNPPFYAKTPSSKERKKVLRDRERVERVDKWMETNEAFHFPLTMQIKEKPKVIKEEHEEEDELVDKEKCAEKDLVESITTPTEAKVSPDLVNTPITEKVEEALEVISIELHIDPIASKAIEESEQVSAGEKK